MFSMLTNKRTTRFLSDIRNCESTRVDACLGEDAYASFAEKQGAGTKTRAYNRTLCGAVRFIKDNGNDVQLIDVKECYHMHTLTDDNILVPNDCHDVESWRGVKVINPAATMRKDCITPLAVAANIGRVPMVQMLIRYGHDVNVQATDGSTPLMEAIMSTSATMDNKLIIITTLIDHGAAPDIETETGHTVMTMAAQLGDVAVMQVLSHSFDNLNWYKPTHKGNTPLMLATYFNHKDATDFLLQIHPTGLLTTNKLGLTAIDIALQRGADEQGIPGLLILRALLEKDTWLDFLQLRFRCISQHGNDDCARLAFTSCVLTVLYFSRFKVARRVIIELDMLSIVEFHHLWAKNGNMYMRIFAWLVVCMHAFIYNDVESILVLRQSSTFNNMLEYHASECPSARRDLENLYDIFMIFAVHTDYPSLLQQVAQHGNLLQIIDGLPAFDDQEYYDRFLLKLETTMNVFGLPGLKDDLGHIVDKLLEEPSDLSTRTKRAFERFIEYMENMRVHYRDMNALELIAEEEEIKAIRQRQQEKKSKKREKKKEKKATKVGTTKEEVTVALKSSSEESVDEMPLPVEGEEKSLEQVIQDIQEDAQSCPSSTTVEIHSPRVTQEENKTQQKLETKEEEQTTATPCNAEGETTETNMSSEGNSVETIEKNQPQPSKSKTNQAETTCGKVQSQYNNQKPACCKEKSASKVVPGLSVSCQNNSHSASRQASQQKNSAAPAGAAANIRSSAQAEGEPATYAKIAAPVQPTSLQPKTNKTVQYGSPVGRQLYQRPEACTSGSTVQTGGRSAMQSKGQVKQDPKKAGLASTCSTPDSRRVLANSSPVIQRFKPVDFKCNEQNMVVLNKNRAESLKPLSKTGDDAGEGYVEMRTSTHFNSFEINNNSLNILRKPPGFESIAVASSCQSIASRAELPPVQKLSSMSSCITGLPSLLGSSSVRINVATAKFVEEIESGFFTQTESARQASEPLKASIRESFQHSGEVAQSVTKVTQTIVESFPTFVSRTEQALTKQATYTSEGKTVSVLTHSFHSSIIENIEPSIAANPIAAGIGRIAMRPPGFAVVHDLSVPPPTPQPQPTSNTSQCLLPEDMKKVVGYVKPGFKRSPVKSASRTTDIGCLRDSEDAPSSQHYGNDHAPQWTCCPRPPANAAGTYNASLRPYMKAAPARQPSHHDNIAIDEAILYAPQSIPMFPVSVSVDGNSVNNRYGPLVMPVSLPNPSVEGSKDFYWVPPCPYNPSIKSQEYGPLGLATIRLRTVLSALNSCAGKNIFPTASFPHLCRNADNPVIIDQDLTTTDEEEELEEVDEDDDDLLLSEDDYFFPYDEPRDGPLFALNWQSHSHRWKGLLKALTELPVEEVEKIGVVNFCLHNVDFLIASTGCSVVTAGITDDGCEMAVKRVVASHYANIKHELMMAQTPAITDHPYLVPYRDLIEFDGFAYIAQDLCEYRLDEYLIRYQSHIDMDQLRRMCWQLMMGLRALHNARIFHGNLRPHNVLISITANVRLTDYGLSKTCLDEPSPANKCWLAPEQLLYKIMYQPASEIYTAGMMMYYIMTGGKHPFGQDPTTCEMCIRNGKAPIIGGMVDHVFMDLLHKMLSPSMEFRPDVDTVLKHPFFWEDKKRLEFLITVGHDPDLLFHRSQDAVNYIENELFYDYPVSWISSLDKLLSTWFRWDKMQLNSVLDFMTVVIPDFIEHYETLPIDIKMKLGNPVRYILTRLPHLFLTTFEAIKKAGWSRKSNFRKFYYN